MPAAGIPVAGKRAGGSRASGLLTGNVPDEFEPSIGPAGADGFDRTVRPAYRQQRRFGILTESEVEDEIVLASGSGSGFHLTDLLHAVGGGAADFGADGGGVGRSRIGKDQLKVIVSGGGVAVKFAAGEIGRASCRERV